MTDRYLYKLLEAVSRKTDIRKLVNEGIDYKQIGDLTTICLTQGYLIFEDKALTITAKGLEKIEIDSKRFKRINKNEWILPDEKSKRKKIDENDIFLPSESELDALKNVVFSTKPGL